MTVRVGINGFGRIGRNYLRAVLEQDADIEVVAGNDLAPAATSAHLLKYDSTFGPLKYELKVSEDTLAVGPHSFRIFSENEPSAIPWGDLGAEVVIESTCKFKDGEKAAAHIEAGSKRVIISAPGTNVDATFVVGVNDDTFEPAIHCIVSNASCTTNCFVPVIKVLDDAFGVEKGLMTTVSAYTNDQNLLDFAHKDLRRPSSGQQHSAIEHGCRPGHRIGAAPNEGPVGRLCAPGARTGRSYNRFHWSTGPRGHRGGGESCLPGGGNDREVGEGPGLHGRSDRELGHRGIPGQLHFRFRADHGERLASQGLRLVRQRVGLQQPPRGPDPHSWPGGKRVLVRRDFNVPMSGDVITDDLRIRLPIETLVWLLDEGAERLTVCSTSRGPKGARTPGTRWHLCGAGYTNYWRPRELIQSASSSWSTFVSTPGRSTTSPRSWPRW